MAYDQVRVHESPQIFVIHVLMAADGLLGVFELDDERAAVTKHTHVNVFSTCCVQVGHCGTKYGEHVV